MSGIKLYISSDNDITLDELKIAETGAWANSATVTATIVDSAGATVSGSSTTLTYVTNSNGKYFGSIPSTVTMTEGSNYKLQIVVSQSGKDATFRTPSFAAGYYEGCAC